MCLGVIALKIHSKNLDIVSPLADSHVLQVLGIKTNKPQKIVMGFLPYWNFKYADETNFQSLTHLVLFGISYNPDGTIRTREENYPEPGWRNLEINTEEIIKRADKNDVKLILAITGFDNDTITQIISSPSATQTLISETKQYIQKKGYEGVNLDFEYQGETSQQIRDNFTTFSKALTTQLRETMPYLEISLDVYADSAKGNRLWDLAKLNSYFDQILVMTYDFHRPSSATAGPVSPVYGAGIDWSQDITTLLAEHAQVTPPEKLLLGIPFYGYEWTTTTNKYLSPTIKNSGQLASYRRIKSIINNPPEELTLSWDDQALSPWLYFSNGNYYQQIYYDDLRSLGLKYDIVNQIDMAGIGIWALGYEGQETEIWDLIEEKF